MALDSSNNPPFTEPSDAPEPVVTKPPTVTKTALAARMDRIASCESGNIASAHNSTSTAKGRFQFLDGTWKTYAKAYWGSEWTEHSVFDYDDNTELAFWVARNYGFDDWSSSRSCWD